MSSSKRWDLVLVLLQHKPEAACIRNRNGMSVLEMAIQRLDLKSQLEPFLIIIMGKARAEVPARALLQ